MTAPPGEGLSVLSFFSGGGGLDLGFHCAGFRVVFASDIAPLFCKTLEANRGRYFPDDMRVVAGDIRRVEPDGLPRGVDLVIGGPPCQSFSAFGRRAGGAAGRLDERGTLFEAYCRLIEAVKPRAFLFENVRGILGTHKGRDWQEIVRAFSRIGYAVSHRILDAADYGVPQHRERLFMVGHKLGGEFLFPEPTHGPDSPARAPHVTAGEALAGLEDKGEAVSLYLKRGKYAHLLPLVPPGGNYLFFTARRGHPEPVFAYRSRFSDFLYKADPAQPVKTIIARPGAYSGPFHWENRRFTLAEYKRLQGFPDDYVFCGGRQDVVRQIGNSVSPLIAEALAAAIAKQIFGRDARARLLPASARLSFDERKGEKARRTRRQHDVAAALRMRDGAALFSFRDYRSRVEPAEDLPHGSPNVTARADGRRVRLTVRADASRELFAEVGLEVCGAALVDVKLYGSRPHAVQTLWNAVDDLVIRSSNFHSLFELYGHFTEPHPVFKVTRFRARSAHPIAAFAEHASDFRNCSRYFPDAHLLGMFGDAFGTRDFTELVAALRAYRFDLRCHETNVAIPPGVYMVAYPFTLPRRRLMSFGVGAARA